MPLIYSVVMERRLYFTKATVNKTDRQKPSKPITGNFNFENVSMFYRLIVLNNIPVSFFSFTNESSYSNLVSDNCLSDVR